ncbi:MAG: protein tyrosine phosphatase [Bacillota bacterium]|nr:protein tyrosine phosphatase [Bacillota bacterium]
MVDLHTHVLWGVDDGAQNLDMTMKMLWQYAEAGYTDIIITPHHDPSRYEVPVDVVKEGVSRLTALAREMNLSFNFYPGHEIQLQAQTPQMLKRGELLSLNNSRYVMIELPFLTKPYYAKEILYRIQLLGYIPIISHPERYRYAQQDPPSFAALVGAGCLLQLNLSSLNATAKEQEALNYFLRNGLYHVVATDAHNTEMRSPNQKEALYKLSQLVDATEYEKLTETNPRRVLLDQMIPDALQPADDETQGRGFFPGASAPSDDRSRKEGRNPLRGLFRIKFKKRKQEPFDR